MASKVDKTDAQEWLESLQQVGEGWWRSVALAIKAGAHKALGMDRREFAQAIGQRMLLADAREAIIELHNQGHSQTAIAEILGVWGRNVNRILAEEGLVEFSPENAAVAAITTGEAKPDEDATDANATDQESLITALQAEVEALTTTVKGEKAKAKRDLDAQKAKVADLRKAITEAKRQAKQDAEAALTEADRTRLAKEAEAWAEEQGRKVLAGLSHLVVESIVGSLEEAAGEVRLLIEQDAVDEDAVRRIETARAGFDEEFNVARMSAAAR